MADINTDDIKRAANKVKSIATSTSSLTSGELRKMISIAEGMKGETAEALQEELQALRTDVQQLSNVLNTVQSRLMRYYQLMKEADEKAAAAIKEN